MSGFRISRRCFHSKLSLLELITVFFVVRYRANMAQPRCIPKQRTNGLKVHRSVKLRMEAEFEDEKRRSKGKKYIPKPHFKVELTWID